MNMHQIIFDHLDIETARVEAHIEAQEEYEVQQEEEASCPER